MPAGSSPGRNTGRVIIGARGSVPHTPSFPAPAVPPITYPGLEGEGPGRSCSDVAVEYQRPESAGSSLPYVVWTGRAKPGPGGSATTPPRPPNVTMRGLSLRPGAAPGGLPDQALEPAAHGRHELGTLRPRAH